MALKKEALEQLKKYGFDTEKFIEAVKADAETDVEIPDFVPIKADDLTSRDNNMKEAGRKEGEEAAKKTLITETAKRLNLEIRGERIGDLVSALEKVKNSSDDQKVRELSTQRDLLQRDKETLASQLEEAKRQAKMAQFDSDLITMFPTNRSTDLSDRERLALVKMGLQFEEVDGKLVAKRNGDVLRDANSQNPLPVADVIKNYFSEKKWVSDGNPAPTPTGGRGGKDTPPPANGGTGGMKKYSDYEAQWLKDNPGKNTASAEFITAVQKHAKEVQDFDFYN